jgi:hypothetical protein
LPTAHVVQDDPNAVCLVKHIWWILRFIHENWKLIIVAADGEFAACNHLRSRQKFWHNSRYHTSKRYCGQPVARRSRALDFCSSAIVRDETTVTHSSSRQPSQWYSILYGRVIEGLDYDDEDHW